MDKVCGNEKCRREFTPTEDERQLYCCKPCSVSQMTRRKNRRKRKMENKEYNEKSRPR